MKNKLKLFAMMLFVTTVTLAQTKWQSIDDGMHLGTYVSPVKSVYGNSTISVLKIDPKKYLFDIGTGHNIAPNDWAKENNFLAVINAGMFDTEGNNLGYLQHYNKLIQNTYNKDNAVLALNPKYNIFDTAQIIDLGFQDYELTEMHYNTLIQSIRMIDKFRSNRWSQQNKMWSVVTAAIDINGNVLFIHCRSPYTMHDFVNIILKSDLNVINMMYLEGGPEASLYINHKGVEKSFIGSFETNFWDNSNTQFWHLPNVIGVVKKQ